jgi:DNA-binding transcriptional ArsR family regulator
LTAELQADIFIHMGEYRTDRLTASFHALAHPTRRDILGRLRDGGTRVTDLAAPFDMSLNTVSKHLKVLERAGLIHRSIRGREHHVRLSAEPLRDVAKWVAHYEQFWNARLDALEELLLEQRAKKKLKPKGTKS